MNRTKRTLSRDAMMNADKRKIANGCVHIFDRIQSWAKEDQVLSAACAFLLLCASANIPAQDVFVAAKNLMYDPVTSTRLGLQFQAMKYHLDTEINA